MPRGVLPQAKVLQRSMQDLQELFEQKLASMVPEHQWEEFETHIQMLLERWARETNAVLFANPVRPARCTLFAAVAFV